mgnify:CR=1 FL=1
MQIVQIQCRLITILIACAFAWKCHGGDWPQILGPNRNGAAVGETLPDSWKDDGPAVVWSHEVGSGFAGPVVAGDRVIAFHRVEDNERVEALSASDGKQLWRADFVASYRGTINPDDGPRCTPTIAGDAVYVYGAAGDLHCIGLTDGKKRWSRAALEDYPAPASFFGAGSSPIVIGDAVLVNVGGRDGAGIVAFSTKTGKTLWKSGDEQASYSSPTTIDIEGKPHGLFVTRYNALIVNPADGKIMARLPFGQRGPTVNAATPLVIDGKIFLTASYGIGAALVKPAGDRLEPVWESDDAMSSQYNTPVHHDGNLYGIHGREDIGEASLRCIDALTGKTRWSEDGFGVAHIIRAGDKLLITKIDGELILARATVQRHTPLARARPFKGTVRAMPALADGHLFARDDKLLKCIAVGEKE